MSATARFREFLRRLSRLISNKSSQRSEPLVLMFHSVSDRSTMELDIPPEVFERQMVWLSENVDVVTPEAYLQSLSRTSSTRRNRASVLLTFDDAYDDFWFIAYPILKRLSLPSVLFVPTGFVSGVSPAPITSAKVSKDRYSAMSWEQIRELLKEGLVTVGAHSHSHREFAGLSGEEIRAEIEHSDAIFSEQIGAKPGLFAYPRGSVSKLAVSVVSERYQAAFGVGRFSLLSRNGSDYLRSRIPVMRSDGLEWFPLRATGQLWIEELCADAVRFVLRRAGAY